MHQFKIKEISNVAKFQGMEVKHFAVGYDVMRKKDFVMCNLDDKFINKSRKELIISRYLSITLMIVNYLNGLFYICIGINFIYQI